MKKSQKHLAVFSPDLIEKVFKGRKSLDIRLSKRAIAPYEQVKRGDKVLIKKSGGKVIGEAEVNNVLYFKNLTPQRLKVLQRKYQQRSMTSDRFWQDRRSVKYGTVIFLKEVKRYLSAIKIVKRDRCGWKIIER